MTDHTRRWTWAQRLALDVTHRALASKVAASAFSAALVVAAAGTTVELLNDEDAWGLVPVALLMMWGSTLIVASALGLRTWAGRRWPRRILAVAASATGGYAIYWLSYEQVEAPGLLVALSVATLSTVAAVSAVLEESSARSVDGKVKRPVALAARPCWSNI